MDDTKADLIGIIRDMRSILKTDDAIEGAQALVAENKLLKGRLDAVDEQSVLTDLAVTHDSNNQYKQSTSYHFKRAEAAEQSCARMREALEHIKDDEEFDYQCQCCEQYVAHDDPYAPPDEICCGKPLQSCSHQEIASQALSEPPTGVEKADRQVSGYVHRLTMYREAVKEAKIIGRDNPGSQRFAEGYQCATDLIENRMDAVDEFAKANISSGASWRHI